MSQCCCCLTGAERHPLVEENALFDHWSPPACTKGGTHSVQANHWKPAAGQRQRGAEDPAQPAGQPGVEPLRV